MTPKKPKEIVFYQGKPPYPICKCCNAGMNRFSSMGAAECQECGGLEPEWLTELWRDYYYMLGHVVNIGGENIKTRVN